jgi:hypothetical protein
LVLSESAICVYSQQESVGEVSRERDDYERRYGRGVYARSSTDNEDVNDDEDEDGDERVGDDVEASSNRQLLTRRTEVEGVVHMRSSCPDENDKCEIGKPTLARRT